MLYVDTSVLVALCTNEAKTAAVAKWYGACTDELASAAWCVTEFASAMGIKQRTGQLTEPQARCRLPWFSLHRAISGIFPLLRYQLSLDRQNLLN